MLKHYLMVKYYYHFNQYSKFFDFDSVPMQSPMNLSSLPNQWGHSSLASNEHPECICIISFYSWSSGHTWFAPLPALYLIWWMSHTLQVVIHLQICILSRSLHFLNHPSVPMAAKSREKILYISDLQNETPLVPRTYIFHHTFLYFEMYIIYLRRIANK